MKVRATPSTLTRSRRLSFAVLFGSGLAVAASWATMLAVLDAGLTVEAGHGAVGSDLRAFVTAARLVVDGSWASMYDPAHFASVGVNAYVNPPFFALPFIPLTTLPIWAAWAVWLGLSMAFLVAALHLIHAPRPAALAAALTLTYPLFLDLKMGQTAALSLLLLAASYRCLEQGRGRAAGVVAGLLAYKPWLLAYLLLWWLVERRRRPSALAAVATSGILVAVSVIAMPAAWGAYPGRLIGTAGEYAAAPVFEYTAWHSIRQLAPNAPTVAVVPVAVVVLGSLLLCYLRFLRSARGHLEACFAASVVAGLLLAPHLFPYDWVILVIPIILLWRAFPRLRDELLAGAAVLAVISLASWPMCLALWTAFGWSVPVAFVTLAAIAVAVGRRVLGEIGETELDVAGDEMPRRGHGATEAASAE